MSDHLSRLRDAVAAVRVTSPASYTWFGAPGSRLPRQWARQLSAEAVATHLSVALAEQLYRDYYTRGRAVPCDPGRIAQRPSPLPGSPRRAVADLIPSQQAWQSGWTVREVTGDRVAVTRGDLTLWVDSVRCVAGRGEPERGRSALVLLPVASTAISPGFLVVNGSRLPVPAAGEPIVRVYWNLRREAAGAFLDSVPRELDRSGVGHVVKVLLDDHERHRCDAAVLYLTASGFSDAAPLLGSLVSRLHDGLRDGTPALTAEVARGVGVAESPAGGASFGDTRCRVIATGILAAHASGPDAPLDQRSASVLAHLVASGVRLDAPHLNPGSTAEYALPVRAAPAPRARRRTPVRPSSRGVARHIAGRLCEEAIWDTGRCNWLAFGEPEPGVDGIPFSALGPDLYDGTSGIALFLAEAARAGADERAGPTALGAARQALDAVAATGTGAEVSVGFYCGAAGVAFAAARVGVLLDQPDLRESARRLAHDSAREADCSEVTDLIGGHAGRVVALLAVARLLADPDLLALAVPSGNRLLDLAVRRACGDWSWRSPRSDRRRLHLTGFAHGAAGIGHALTELYAAVGDDRYRDAAFRAFSYERTWFSAAEGNWPDLRNTNRRRVAEGPVFPQAWCHGAPGIALSRLRAHDILRNPVLLDEARVAVSTTLRAVEETASAGPIDYSLCHGLLGLVDVLAEGLRHASGDCTRVRRLVESVVRDAATYARGEHTWPCGSATGREVPGLMLGLAGIGHLHLRLRAASAVPSLLLPGPSTLRVQPRADAS